MNDILSDSPDRVDQFWTCASVPFAIRPYTQNVLLASDAQHHSHDSLLFVELVAYKGQDGILPKPSEARKTSDANSLDICSPRKSHLSATPLRNRSTHFPPFGSSSQTGLRIEEANSYESIAVSTEKPRGEVESVNAQGDLLRVAVQTVRANAHRWTRTIRSAKLCLRSASDMAELE
jgi:hypothetical protein